MRRAFFLLLLVFFLAGCTSAVKDANDANSGGNTVGKPVEKIVEKGDTIKVGYVGKLLDGTIFDQSRDESPLEFTVGSGKLILGFDKGVLGLKVGEKKTLTIPPEEAYGARDENLVFEVPLSQFGEQAKDMRIGMPVTASNGARGKIIAIYTDTNTAELDFNPELAGKTLVFEVTVKEISKKSG